MENTEQARILAEEERRKADIEHRKAVNNIVLNDLVNICGLDEQQAKKVVIAVAKYQIQHLQIVY